MPGLTVGVRVYRPRKWDSILGVLCVGHQYYTENEKYGPFLRKIYND